MHRLLIAACCVMLAACGGVPNGYSERVKGKQAEVYAALSRFHGGMAPELAGVPAITKSTPGNEEIRYLLRSAEGKGEGTVTFSVEADGEDDSIVSVLVDMPEIEADIDGTKKELSEAKAAIQIYDALHDWAEQRASGKPTTDKLAAIDNRIGFLLLSLSPQRSREAVHLAGSGTALREFTEDYLAWIGDPAAGDRASALASDPDSSAGQAQVRPRVRVSPRDESEGGWGDAVKLEDNDGAKPLRKGSYRGKLTDDWGA